MNQMVEKNRALSVTFSDNFSKKVSATPKKKNMKERPYKTKESICQQEVQMSICNADKSYKRPCDLLFLECYFFPQINYFRTCGNPKCGKNWKNI